MMTLGWRPALRPSRITCRSHPASSSASRMCWEMKWRSLSGSMRRCTWPRCACIRRRKSAARTTCCVFSTKFNKDASRATRSSASDCGRIPHPSGRMIPSTKSEVMRKLIMWNLITLDGMFEGSQPWDLQFHEYAWGDELRDFSLEQGQEAGALLFGRRTYEGMAAYWSEATDEIADFMNAVPKYVVSRTLEDADWANSTLVKDDVVGAVSRLKEQEGKDLFVFGSAELSDTLLRHGLFDELRIGLVPFVLGDGSPLFKQGFGPSRLALRQTRPLGDRCLLLVYEPMRAGDS